MKFLVVALAFLAVAKAQEEYFRGTKDATDPDKIQDSPEPTDLEVRPASMSPQCKAIFAPLQSKPINDVRDKCKDEFPELDDESLAKKNHCILKATFFVGKKGEPIVDMFKAGIESVRKEVNNDILVNRTVTAFQFCYDKADAEYKSANYEGDVESNPIWTKYGLCLWEMVKKICSAVYNNYSNTDKNAASWAGEIRRIPAVGGPP